MYVVNGYALAPHAAMTDIISVGRVQYLLLGISGSAALVAVLVLPETYSVVLLRKRAVRLRKETGDEGYMTSQERFKRPLAQVLRESLIRPLQLLVTEPIIFLFSVGAPPCFFSDS
jgi:hypothetical protein